MINFLTRKEVQTYMAIITKKEFASRCGVSIPTLYKWIEKNKDGLKAYVNPNGIDEAVFDEEQWREFRSIAGQKQKTDGDIKSLLKEIEQLKEKVEEQKKTIGILDRELQSKDQQIQNLTIMMGAQLKALSAPKEEKQRRTFLEWLGVRRKDEQKQEQ